MDSLQSLLPKVLKKRGLHGQATASLVVHLANQWLSEHLGPLGPQLRAEKCEQGVLVISAENSIAAGELVQRQEELLRALDAQKHSGLQLRVVRR